MTGLLAHQGGWDEVVMFLVPLLLALLAVRWAERRARRRADDAAERGEEPEPGGSDLNIPEPAADTDSPSTIQE